MVDLFSSSDTQFEIPTTGGGYNYNVDCDSDGTNEATAVNGNYICNYNTAGDYTISITGDFPQIYSDFSNDCEKLLSVNQWGNGVWRSMKNAFSGCINMTVTANDTPDLSQVTDMSQMFLGARKFNQNINNWDVSNVTNMK